MRKMMRGLQQGKMPDLGAADAAALSADRDLGRYPAAPIWQSA